MSASRYTRLLAVSLLCAISIGVGSYFASKYAYAHHWLNYDISDGDGHGPDPDGIEGQRVYAVGTIEQARLFGVVGAFFGFATPLFFALSRRNTAATPAASN